MSSELAGVVVWVFLTYCAVACLIFAAIFAVWWALDYWRRWAPVQSWAEVRVYLRTFVRGDDDGA